MMDRQAYLDLYEVFYENARDAGFPPHLAEKFAERDATRELAKPSVCELCERPLGEDGECDVCDKLPASVEANRSCGVGRDDLGACLRREAAE